MKIPKWMFEVNPHSSISSKDVMKMFGYKTLSSLDWAIEIGKFPDADWRGAGPNKRTRTWLIPTIITEIKRRNRMEACK